MNNSFIAPLNGSLDGVGPELGTNSEGLSARGLVDLNRVVQQALAEQQPKLARLQAIIRCDVLPLVQGHTQLFQLLFRKMLGLILDHPPQNSKLFIYLKCDKKATDILDLSLPDGFTHHEISFYTNSNITPEWEMANSDILDCCQRLTHETKGSLSWQTASGGGCLFAVNLPGKLN